jgi:hypothetical protein
MIKKKAAEEAPKGAVSAAQSIDAAIKRHDDWRGETLAKVRALIKEADPDVVEDVKWRKPSNNMQGVSTGTEVSLIVGA